MSKNNLDLAQLAAEGRITIKVVLKDPSGVHSFITRSEAAERLRKVADLLEVDSAVDLSATYWVDTSGSWEINTDLDCLPDPEDFDETEDE